MFSRTLGPKALQEARGIFAFVPWIPIAGKAKWIGGTLFNWLVVNFSFAIPAKRLRETESLLAFHHPQPGHRTHILIVPKRNYKSILDVPSSDGGFFDDLLRVVSDLVREFDLEERGYWLLTNGGAYQDVNHLHIHLISDEN